MSFTLGKKMMILTIILGIVIALGVGLTVYLVSERLYYSSFINSKMNLVRTIAASINGDEYAGFTDRTATKDPGYLRYLSYLNSVSKEKNITYLYTLSLNKKGDLVYAIDSEIADFDTLWVESELFAFQVSIRPDETTEATYEQITQPQEFEVKAGDRHIPVRREKQKDGTMLFVAGQKVVFIYAGLPRKIGTDAVLLCDERRDTDVAVRIGDNSIDLHCTLSLRGESQSLPGQPFIDSEGTIAQVKKIIVSGVDWVDPSPKQDNYGTSISFFSPIRNNWGKSVGAVALDVYQTDLDAFRLSLFGAGGIYGAIIFLFLIISLFLFTRYLTVPIFKLNQAAKKVSEGYFDTTVNIARRDELGELAATFNNMIGSLSQHMEERKQTELNLSKLAYTDTLTGLLNRKSFYDRLSDLLMVASRSKNEKIRALLLIDLDRFKDVNDSLGHDAGDTVLVEAASRIRSSIRGTDFVFRFGGDEFIVLLTALTRETDASIVAEKIIEMFDEPFLVANQYVRVGASIGITVYPIDGNSVDILVRNADMALYEAKIQRMAYRFFTQELQAKASERSGLITELHSGIKKNQYVLHYQPQVDIHGNIVGAEALIRWVHPERGMIPPAIFIPVLEETGLIVPLGKWVIKEACSGLAKFPRSEFGDISISINLSLKQFQDRELMETILHSLSEERLAANRVIFEITESLIMEDKTVAMTMEILHSHGIRFSIDDFGTGYSSLARLKTLPVDEVKIDRSFLAGLPNDKSDCGVAKAIIAIAHEFGLSVVAEGVENLAQKDFLIEAGCDVLQGYLFSRPVPAYEFIKLASNIEQFAYKELESHV